jgi:type I restriction enzyme M protein
MLNIADQWLTRLNPKARLEMFGQELNPETWAIEPFPVTASPAC